MFPLASFLVVFHDDGVRAPWKSSISYEYATVPKIHSHRNTMGLAVNDIKIDAGVITETVAHIYI